VKLLITGATGQLGTDLVLSARLAGHEVVACSHRDLEITNSHDVHRVVDKASPETIIHAAAWTAVDACESNPKKAMAVNRDGTSNIVRAAQAVGARVLYISTDYVFDGTKTDPYIETDLPNPQSVYGASKLAGEREIKLASDSTNDLTSDLASELAGHIIVRISWVCGEHGANMVKTILRLAATNTTLTFVDDQIGCPTFTSDAAPMIVQLATSNHRGIWHVTNQGVTSWFGFARDVLTAAGLDPNRVVATTTKLLTPSRPAKRPANSVLANEEIRKANLPLLDDYHIPLQRLVDRLTS